MPSPLPRYEPGKRYEPLCDPLELLTESVLASLPAKQEAVMRALYGIGFPLLTEPEAARRFNLTRDRIVYSRYRLLRRLDLRQYLMPS